MVLAAISKNGIAWIMRLYHRRLQSTIRRPLGRRSFAGSLAIFDSELLEDMVLDWYLRTVIVHHGFPEMPALPQERDCAPADCRHI